MAPRTKTENTNSSILDDIQRAEAQAAARMKAPDITVSGFEKSREKQIVSTFAPDCVGKDALFHPFWGDPRDHKRYIDKGYIPVAHDGEHVAYEEMRLYKLPMELHKRDLALNEMVSKRMLGERLEADQREVRASVIAGQAMGEEKVSVVTATSDADVQQAMAEMDRWDREK
jgi:hypothetical protein